MKRRHVIIGGVALTGAAVYALRPSTSVFSHMGNVAWASETAPAQSSTQIHKVDCNHEVTPPFLDTDGVGWNADDAIAWMDSQGIANSLLCVPPRHFASLSAADLTQATQRSNDYLAEQVARHPDRFGMLASLPVPHPDESVKELVRAMEELNADGITLPGSSSGIFLGEAHYAPLMHELNQRQVSVLVKPGRHPTSNELQLSLPDALVEQTCDITRAAVNMMFKGTLEDYPHIHWILSEGGGFLPFIAWRLSLANVMPGLTDHAPQGVMHYLRRYWVDTTHSHNPVNLAVLQELFGPEKILFGSGYPAAQPSLREAEALVTREWSSRIVQGIHRHHALSLFPRLAGEEKRQIPLPVYRQQSGFAKLQAQAIKPVRDFAQKLRD